MRATPFAAIGIFICAACADDTEDVRTVTTASTLDPAFVEDETGLVSIETEHFHDNVPVNGQAWTQEASFLASGGAYMRALPNLGNNVTANNIAMAPRMEFKVNFRFTGDHYVWQRGEGATGQDDADHAGVDGVVTAAQVGQFPPSWGWIGTRNNGVRARITVATTGVHTVTLWMREDGLSLDKLVISTSRDYVPTGMGPAESAREQVCGNGIPEGTEQCDGGDCCTATCTFEPATTTCRGSAGACDVAETCTGSSATCPADTYVSAGTECRGSAGGCDVAEACTGSDPACPADGFVAGGTECRAAAGGCDVAEACTGSDPACPADGFVAGGTECRAAAGGCDVAEACTGTGAACPADSFVAAGTECRGSAGACDVAEACTGTGAACPADSFVAAGTECRGSAGGCDVAEACTGSGAACPDDSFVAAGTECRASAGGCDVAEACTGSGAVCPADAFIAAGTECRASAGACDVAEACTGSGAACPADSFVAAGTECRGSAGACDVAEACTGSGAACPDDSFVAAGTECRASAGGCDVAEACTGGGAACPADAVATAGTECRAAAGACDVAESCDGSGTACPADSFVAAGTECRGSAGICDVAEACSGGAAACPADSFVAAGTECRGSAGICDVAEACSGSAAACPNDGFVAAGTECRGSAGPCDVAESCSGSGATCPNDAYAPAGTSCRDAVDACDVTELCAGDTVACPPDDHINEPPVVNAGSDVEVPITTGDATLAGTVTDDGCPTASTLESSWSTVSGPGSVTFADASAASTTATFSAGGIYELQLTANDDIQTTFDRVRVTVNIAPFVNAGPDRIINDAQAVLIGAVSDDGVPAGASLTSSWTVLSGPGSVQFAPPDQAVTTATFSTYGTYVLRLSATDSAMTTSDDVQVIYSPRPELTVTTVVPPPLDGNTLDVSGVSSAVLSNLGGATETPFTVTFFEDRNGNGKLDPEGDNILGTATQNGMGENEILSIDAAVSGTMAFAGNVTYAFVDSGLAIPEVDESNNVGDSAPPCETHPPAAGGFTPTREWAWTQPLTAPQSFEVQMTPAVADLNRDGVPDIVFTSYPVGAPTQGNLRAIDGRTGAELFTVTDTQYTLSGTAQLAVGDIDLDGYPEVVAVASNTQALIAFEHTGAFKWRYNFVSPAVALIWGGPALADLDADGVPEIVAGKSVVNNNGTLRWTGAGGAGSGQHGPLATVADLDLDGRAEVIAGRTVYRLDGSIWWSQAGLADGLSAVGNLDADPFPEVVLTSPGRLSVLEHDGAVKWSQSTTVLGPDGGPAAIADFDGDGANEIVRSANSRLGVWETDGSLKWSMPITDSNSGSATPAAFDFDNDGAADIVFGDEWGLRVFRGANGESMFTERLGSCTGYDNPVVADADADGRAELIVVANTTCIVGNLSHGVFVYGNDAWVGARQIWNQHTYHVKNVDDDASIPAPEPPGPPDTFRCNVVASCPYALPDLTASYLRVTNQGVTRELTIRIGNGGANPVPPGVAVRFYDGDPRKGGPLLGVGLTVGYLAAETYEDVAIVLPELPTNDTIWVAADDLGELLGALFESDESNNLYDSGVDL